MSVLALSILITFVGGMIAAVGLLASRSGTLQGSSAATTQVFQASTDFSGKQGQKGWYYLDEMGNPSLTYYASHAQCGPNPCWKGAEDYQLVLGMGQHPGPTKDAIRGWMAPGNGSVRITGKVADGGPPCGGDGVHVKIKQDPNILWQASLSDGDATGKTFNVTSNVSSGQFIYFMVNKGSVNNWCDWTPFDPKIEFTPGGSGPPPPTTKTTIYKLSTDFSPTQWATGWGYGGGGGTSGPVFTYFGPGTHAECGSSACWHGSQAYQIIGSGWVHPGGGDLNSRAILRWKAPETGNVKITASVQLGNPTCSDGIFVSMGNLDPSLVIPAKDKDPHLYTNNRGVLKGEILDFNISKGASVSQNNKCDWTAFDPKIEFTPDGSGQPAPPPPSGEGKAKISISLKPSPAPWHDNSRGTGYSSCIDGKMINPNGWWVSNLTLKETGGNVGATLTTAVVEQYDSAGNLERTDTSSNFHNGISVKAGSYDVDQLYVNPRKNSRLKRVVLTLSGKDDNGNAVVATAGLSLQGSHKLASCRNGGTFIKFPIFNSTILRQVLLNMPPI